MKRTPKNWIDYELIDCGEGLKLEKFGEVTLIRPEPKAIWNRSMDAKKWRSMAHAEFIQKSSNSGSWNKFKPFADDWKIRYKNAFGSFTFHLKLTRFKHVGLFPEQAINWDLIGEELKQGSRFINLFAYTGAASIFAKAQKADVYHVDSIKQVLAWGKKNMEVNQLENIRWVLEDALKFVSRENKRGNKYDFVLMDPPSFGHGPKGEKWALNEKINDLLETCSGILKDSGKLVWNNYSLGLSELAVHNLLTSHFKGKNITSDELYLEDSFGKKMSMGIIGIVG